MADDPQAERESIALSVSVLTPSAQVPAAMTVNRFRMLAEEAGYELDELRMAFAGMALTYLMRDDLSATDVHKSIASIRDVASLMGVDSKPIDARKRAQQDADLIIDAINPRIEGLLDAIERGRHASEIDDPGAGLAAASYEEVSD